MGQGLAHFNKQSAKRRNERDRLLFIAAAGLAFSLLVIMLVVLNYQSDASAKDHLAAPSSAVVAAPQVGTITLYVPERPVQPGQKLSEVPLREIFWPRNQVPDGAILDRAEVKDLYAKVELPTGLPLQHSHLTSQPAQATLPVTPGNRAVTIEVDATSGLEGLALPGTRVDVVLTYMENAELTSKVIVQNARVLASGSDTTSINERLGPDKKAAASPARTVTLDVSTRDALRISTARQLGRLGLTMRAAEDNKVSPELEVSAGEVGGELPKKKTADRVITSTCTRGHYRVNGREFQLNCDGTSLQLDGGDE